MEMNTPQPEEVPGAFPGSAATASTNGVNGDGSKAVDSSDGEGPAPPPHRTPTPPVKVDAEACKAAGNKFYKAGEYGRAIEEYSKGRSSLN